MADENSNPANSSTIKEITEAIRDLDVKHCESAEPLDTGDYAFITVAYMTLGRLIARDSDRTTGRTDGRELAISLIRDA